jgi:hypothetical protein
MDKVPVRGSLGGNKEGKKERGRGKIREKRKNKKIFCTKRKLEIEKEKKNEGHYRYFTSYLSYTARRSCFVKRFSKTASPPAHNPLHQHSHSQSCHNCNQSLTKRTLYSERTCSIVVTIAR